MPAQYEMTLNLVCVAFTLGTLYVRDCGAEIASDASERDGIMLRYLESIASGEYTPLAAAGPISHSNPYQVDLPDREAAEQCFAAVAEVLTRWLKN